VRGKLIEFDEFHSGTRIRGINLKNNKKEYIAHVRKDGVKQSVGDHLSEVGVIASKLAAKIKVSSADDLIGLLHDFGKFSMDFQEYIGSTTGLINPDEDENIDFVETEK